MTAVVFRTAFPRALRASLLLLVVACAHVPPKDEQAVSYRLFTSMPANPFGKTVYLSQRITGTFKSQNKTLQFEVELRPDRLVMVATSQLGLPLFTIEYDGVSGDIQKKVPLGGAIDPNWILNDFLLAYWPKPLLAAHLADPGEHLTDSEGTRTLTTAAGAPLVKVHYLTPRSLGADLDLENFKYGYTLSVRTYQREEGGAAS